MVYNKTSSDLNSSLWAPHFSLTTVGSTLRAEERGTFMVDRDIGEMFLNFMFSEDVRYFCEVEIINLRTEEEWGNHRSGGW